MGVMKEKRIAAQPQRRYRRFDQGVQTADWSSVHPSTLVDAISTVAHTGGALRFGYTRDGGAYAVGVYGDGDPYTVYIRPNEDVEKVLQGIADAFITPSDSPADPGDDRGNGRK